MLTVLTVVIMLAVAYSFFVQGLLTSICMLVNVFIAGLVAFNFWEPIAESLSTSFTGSPVQGYEDWICLIGLFIVTLSLLRLTTNVIATSDPEIRPAIQQVTGAFLGLLTGYLTAGFLVCAMQTLPIGEDFMGFSAKIDAAGGMRRFLPADRVWLALMRRGSVGSLDNGAMFDKTAYFELGYERHRRFGETRDPLRYGHEDLPIDHGQSE
jgi:uncharacterized membrane protein required for colicin V production